MPSPLCHLGLPSSIAFIAATKCALIQGERPALLQSLASVQMGQSAEIKAGFEGISLRGTGLCHILLFHLQCYHGGRSERKLVRGGHYVCICDSPEQEKVTRALQEVVLLIWKKCEV